MVERYRQAGHAIYLDDFGSGYANLNYLQTITFDVLKIDKTLVDPLPGKNLLPQVIILRVRCRWNRWRKGWKRRPRPDGCNPTA